VQQLAMLSATRQRLNVVYNQLAGPLGEQQSFINSTLQKKLQRSCQSYLKAIGADRQAIDKAIDQLIASDEQLAHLFGIITSVPGIGMVTATEVIITSNELQTIRDPKKMAYYAGVAPFTYQSASSVRGRPGVSQHARKWLKSLFHPSAMAAIRVKDELQDYYQRKTRKARTRCLS
jgi:transposase